MSKTYSEIKSQYSALAKTISHVKKAEKGIKDFFEANKEKNLIITGCGSSYILCKSAELLLASRKGLCSTVIPSGDILVNFESYEKLMKNSVILTLSRSGSTSEVIQTVKLAKAKYSSPVFSLVCTADSELSALSDFCIEMPWAFDESVCQTRCVTNFYTTLLLITAILSDDSKLMKDIQRAADNGDAYLDKIEKDCKKLADMEWSNVMILADGEMQGISEEGALAFTEIAQVPGVYYHLLDSRHGPLVLVNEQTLAIVNISNGNLDLQRDFIKDLVSNGAKVVVYSSERKAFEGVRMNLSSELGLDDAAAGIPFVNICQMTAYFRACKENIDPDAPDGLNAWIKL